MGSAAVVRRVLPFGLAVALMGFVLARIDWSAFRAQLGSMDLPSFAAFVSLFVLALLSADTFATASLYRRTIKGLAARDLWVIRGASYLPSLLNHHVGQAWLTYFLSRAYGVELATVAGTTVLSYASWAGCLLLIGAAALLGTDLAKAWLAVPFGAGVAYLILLALRPARLARVRLLAPLFDAGVRGHLEALAVRVPHAVVLFLGTWLPFWFFDVRVPLEVALRYMPVLMVAVTLPITPQGIGTRDALAATFFERFADGATREARLGVIAAATTTTLVALVLVEALLGLLLLGPAGRLMGRRQG